MANYSGKATGLFKMIDHILYLTKEPVDVEFNGITRHVEPPKKVMVSPLLFRSDECTQCGTCCTKVTLCWTNEGFKRIAKAERDDYEKWGLAYEDNAKLLESLEGVVVRVNGKEVPFWVYHQNKLPTDGKFKKEPCNFRFKDGDRYRCAIHPVKPISCALPHTNFFNKQGGTTYLRKQQFGRNWAIGCPAVIGENEVDWKSFEEWDEYWLARLDMAAFNDMGISTYLGAIRLYAKMYRQSRCIPKDAVDIIQWEEQVIKQMRLI